VPLHPINDTIEVLRRTMMEVERDLDPVCDAAALSALKRIVLNRIAELELYQCQENRIAARSVRPLSVTIAPSAQKSQTEGAGPDRTKKP
jgi:hypothetical protein